MLVVGNVNVALAGVVTRVGEIVAGTPGGATLTDRSAVVAPMAQETGTDWV